VTDLLVRGRAVASSWWFVPALALVVVALLAAAWNGQRLAARAAVRLAEAADLRAKGFGAAVEVKEAQLKERIASAAGLKAEVERLKKASPGSRPVVVASGTTGPLVAAGAARPGNDGAPSAGAPVEPAHDAPPDVSPHLTPPVCLLAVGDAVELRANAAALRTPAGNLVVVGTAEAWRLQPAPAARLFGGPLKLDISALPPPSSLGWGVGLMASASRSGWAAGPMLSPPPWVVLGYQVEALAGAGIGPSGDWSAVLAALVRR
jgi:hypothetical protein